MLDILTVIPDSIAEELGFKRGDKIISINGEDVCDVIDYKFLVSDERVAVKIRTAEGRVKTVSITKGSDDTLGVEFSSFPIKRCRNKCIFCFVSQMPPGCRKSLYVKDDDFRASFLYGNYITLGSLTEPDWERIFRQRLSPLYISVHTTDLALRRFMLGNRNAPDIMASLRRLADGGIRMHTQIVLCPGVNDARFLDRTLDDLSGLFPAVASVAIVPVGMTDFRKGLFPLRKFTTREARAVLKTAMQFGDALKKQFGSRFVFASDEFYIQAGEDFPAASFYEDFPQVENGVGMVAAFLREASRTRLPLRVSPVKITLVTGVSFSKLLKDIVKKLERIQGVAINLITVKNSFFGPSVTVAGLLTGQDLVKALKRKRLGDQLLIPAGMLKEEEDVFLDNMTLKQLEKLLQVTVTPVAGFREIMNVVRKGRTVNDLR